MGWEKRPIPSPGFKKQKAKAQLILVHAYYFYATSATDSLMSLQKKNTIYDTREKFEFFFLGWEEKFGYLAGTMLSNKYE